MRIAFAITRYSKCLGFGYCIWTPEHQEAPTEPQYTGSVSQIFAAMASDKTLASLRGGVFFRTQWFIKFGKIWVPILFAEPPVMLVMEVPFIFASSHGYKTYEADIITAFSKEHYPQKEIM